MRFKDGALCNNVRFADIDLVWNAGGRMERVRLEQTPFLRSGILVDISTSHTMLAHEARSAENYSRPDSLKINSAIATRRGPKRSPFPETPSVFLAFVSKIQIQNRGLSSRKDSRKDPQGRLTRASHFPRRCDDMSDAEEAS